MAGANNWRTQIGFEDWVGDKEKRILSIERRPGPSARSLLGPGFGPFANELVDWNSDEAAFTGHFYSDVGALNSPDPLRQWVGHVISLDSGNGIQRLTSLDDDLLEAVRRFSTTNGDTPVFTSWETNASTDTAWTNLTLLNGYTSLETVQYRRKGGELLMRGRASIGAAIVAGNLPDGFRPAVVMRLPVAVDFIITQGPSAGTAHVHNAVAASRATVQPNGDIEIPNGQINAWVEFAGIRFEVA